MKNIQLAVVTIVIGIGVVVGCNQILGNEDGVPRVSSNSQPSALDAGRIASDDGGVCDRDAGTKTCFGLCVSTDQVATGCGGESCVACDPRNVAATQCQGATRTCGYDSCDPDYGDCDGDKASGCETSLIDRKNCGDCGRVCPDGQPLCAKSDDGTYACVESCQAPTAECNGACVTFDTIENCGSCGTRCEISGGQASCVAGACAYECPALSHLCGKTCVSVVDPKACGTGCVECPSGGPNTIAVCSGGTCGVRCEIGWNDCDFDLQNGCETRGKCFDDCCGGTSGGPLPASLAPNLARPCICPY